MEEIGECFLGMRLSETPFRSAKRGEERHKICVTEQRRQELEARWQQCCQPLPGSIPYLNQRPCRIKAKEEGLSFREVLSNRFPGKLSDAEWEQVFLDGLIVRKSDGEAVTDSQLLVTAGHQYLRLLPDWVEPAVATNLKVLAEDEVLLVIDKPAPLPMHEGGRFCKNTLIHLMGEAWPELEVRYTHRLDAETSGVVICVKGQRYRSAVQKSFEQGQVAKSYLARVLGHPNWENKLVDRTVPAEGRWWGQALQARTEFSVRERCQDGTTLIEARPLTGRTHQIRVHLWQEGFPICGDRLYLPEGQLGEVELAGVGAEPLALRCWKMSLPHPVTGERIIRSVEPSLRF